MESKLSTLLGPRSGRPFQPPRRSSRRFWLTVLGVLLLLITSGIVYAFSFVRNVVEEVSEPLPPEVLPEVRPMPVQVGQRINILVMGLDQEKLRSDAMMLVSVDPEGPHIGVLQIPRDTRALVAGKGTLDKINAAYAYGVGDKQFPANLRALKTVEDLLDVTIHYTMVVELEGFVQVIEGLGSVTVDIPFKMDYDDPDQNLHIHFEPGRQELNGQQALEFIRWRHNNDGTGYPDQDLGRIRTQQKFIRTLLDELLKPSNLPSLPNQAMGAARHVSTTMEPNRILAMAKLAASVRGEHVEFATLPGTDGWLIDPQDNLRKSFYIHDPGATRVLVDRLIRGIDPEEAARVRVQIATAGTDPRVGELVERLASQGFVVSTVVRPGPELETTRIIDLSGDERKRQLVGRSLVSQGYLVEAITEPGSDAVADVQIILGKADKNRP